MKKITIVALLSVCVATQALADNADTFYVAVDRGQASFSNAMVSINSTVAAPNPGAMRIAGGYNINSMFAVEAGYVKFGDSTYITTVSGVGSANETLSSSSFQVAAVGTYPINAKFSLFGKLGFANNKINYSYSDTLGGTNNGSGTKTDVMYGIGGQYNINSKWGIRVQYEDFGKTQVSCVNCTGENIGLSMLSIGGVYTF